MRHNGKRILACLLSFILLAACLSITADIAELKDGDYKYEDFFAEEDNFDVLFLGTSHVIDGIYPMELWKDYGITSYNMGGHGNLLPTTYWMMKLALQYTNPSLIVIDCMNLYHNYKTSKIFSQVHQSLDAFPLSLTKIRAVYDLLDDDVMDRMIEEGIVEVSEERIPISLLWNFSVYHSRWTELKENDFQLEMNIQKGAEYLITVAEPNDILSVPEDEKIEDDTIGVQYLERMIEECQAGGIDILLINLPFPAEENDLLSANRVYDIAEEYGVDYINFLAMDVVDYETDCADEGSHLNASGARKVTSYLGNYITEHYDVIDRRTDPDYDDWNEDYQIYREYKIDILLEQDELDVYLMLLADQNWDAVLELYDLQILENDSYCKLLENLGVDVDLVKEKKFNVINVSAAGESVTYRVVEQPEESECSVRISVTDHDLQEVVDTVSFDITSEWDSVGTHVIYDQIDG